MVIIEPTPDDYAALADLHNRAIRPFLAVYSPAERAAYGDDLYETEAGIADAVATREVLCAKDAVGVAGFAIFRLKNPYTVWLSSLYVDPERQRTGIGASLLGGVEDFAKTRRAKAIALETHAQADWALAFYHKNGFTVVNDVIQTPPYGHLLDKPPVPSHPVLAKYL